MGAIDILIILLFIGSIIYGLARGVIVQLGSVGGILGGIVLCRLFGTALTNLFVGSESTPNEVYVAGVFANVILFLAGYLSIRVVAHLVKSVASKLRLTPIDRVCGAAFSLFEWFFLFSLLLNVWQAVDKKSDVTGGSKLFEGRTAAAVIDFAPMVVGSETAQSLWDALPDKR